MTPAQLGQRIRKAREAAGLSVERLAALVGIDVSVQRKVEKGQSGVSAQRLAQYASHLRTSSSWLNGEVDREARE